MAIHQPGSMKAARSSIELNWNGGVGVEPGHGVVQDQATFDGLEAISDKRGVDGIEGLLG